MRLNTKSLSTLMPMPRMTTLTKSLTMAILRMRNLILNSLMQDTTQKGVQRKAVALDLVPR
jgi:hypothetical protein